MVYCLSFLCSITIGVFLQYGRRELDNNKMKACIDRSELICRFGMFFSALPIFIISAVRYGIGTDYFYTYYPMFVRIAKGDSTTHYEIGFLWLNKIIARFTDDPQWLFVITSAVFVFASYYAIYKISNNIPEAILLFLLSYTYFVSLNNVRQSFASAIIFIAVTEYWEEKRIRPIVLVLIAGLFHQSALLFLIVFLVEPVILHAESMTVLAIAILGAGRVAKPVVLKIASMFPRLASYFIQNDLIQYLERSISTIMVLVNIAIMLMIAMIEHNNPELYESRDRKWNCVKWIQFICIGLCGLDGIIPAMYRIIRIFSFMQFLIIPYAISREKNEASRRIYSILIVAAFCILFIKLLHDGTEEVIPYRSIFSAIL